MSTIEVNKIVGAILVALLVLKVADIVGEAAVHPKEQEKVAYAVGAPAAEQAAVTPSEKPEKEGIAPIAPLLAEASVEQGKSLARRCAVCHTFEKEGRNKIGPPLWGIVGSDKAGVSGFNYSSALSGLQGKWTYENLNRFLADPRGYAPGTKMVFPGLRTPEDRADVIAYLRTLADNPPPLP